MFEEDTMRYLTKMSRWFADEDWCSDRIGAREYIKYDNSMSGGTQIEWIASVSGPEAVEVVLRLSGSVLVSNMCAKNQDVEDRSAPEHRKWVLTVARVPTMSKQ